MNYQRKFIISILLFVIINGAMIGFLVLPTFREIKLSSKEYLEQKKELATIKAEISNFKDFEKNYHLYQKGLKEMEDLIFNQLFADKELPIDLMNFLNEQSDDHNLSLKITSLDLEKTKEDPWDFVALRLNLEGQFPEFLKFLKKIENSRWLIEINDLLISKKEKEGIINISSLIKVYANR
jgi:Tfp pilus assembly protein PilO